jgi:hypothetical protein
MQIILYIGKLYSILLMQIIPFVLPAIKDFLYVIKQRTTPTIVYEGMCKVLAYEPVVWQNNGQIPLTPTSSKILALHNMV